MIVFTCTSCDNWMRSCPTDSEPKVIVEFGAEFDVHEREEHMPGGAGYKIETVVDDERI